MLETHMYLDLRGLETKRQFEIYPIVKKQFLYHLNRIKQ